MNITPREIAVIVNGKLMQPSENNTVSEFLIDSRLLLFPAKTVFFAIKTEHNDGHYFIEDLYQKGVRTFVISDERFPVSAFPEATFVLTSGTVGSLQAIAKRHRQQLAAHVIAITGSNGKTIVKEWLKQIMEGHFRVSATPKSYNSQIGVPLSVVQADAHAEVAIFEAGISQTGEMSALQEIILPHTGLITNIGQAHGENFTSIREKLQEKLLLFRQVGKIIFCSDQEMVDKEVRFFAKKHDIPLFSWGHHADNQLFIEKITTSSDHSVLKLRFDNRQMTVTVPFTDTISIENTLHCFAVALCCGMDADAIAEEISRLKPVALRLELQKGVNGCVIVNDSYNLDIDSLRGALDFLHHQKNCQRKTLVLSDILQSDKPDALLYHNVAEMVREKELFRFIGVGSRISAHKMLFPEESLFFDTTEKLIDNLKDINFFNEVILLKGARIFHFETVNRILQEHTHETVLEVNLNALIHNFNYFRSKVYPAGIMAMVKASAYGSGGNEIANTLQYYGVNYLTVAYTDEGVTLRKAGITVPIMVMNPEEESFEDIIAYDLEPEIYNFRTLDMLEKAMKNQLFYHSGIVRFHIKLDTGMHRLGFMEHELDYLIQRVLSLKNSRVQSLFSHLAGSDDPRMDDFTRLQIADFDRMSKKIIAAMPDKKIFRHINNSHAAIRFPESQFDMVRLGIGLYGVSSLPEEQKQLLPVNRLYTTISQIKELPAGDFVGYNHGYKTEKTAKIAILSIGYADGLLRSLKKNGKARINGILCPIIGNICMDMCMVDLSGVEAKEGDRVEIFGENQSITDFAAQAGTIPYEILTGISPRVKRIYVQE
ncbi:MAG: bifunctional UDP-N-acetylmuramoyl-tripeptide:D-alanyl-D-alanine ligase/alanine racemase [Bacteroidales bacterium]|nr:bifunctional UDP-N-acetylmuramoyl-tripeptide:D-alanyl-D-alanine ligase/alanine racemase [Bacteroidales bacterium]